MNSLVYGDSYRAKVLFSSIPAPVPDLWGQGLHIICDWIFFNVITYSIQLSSPESQLHTLCSLKSGGSTGVGGIRAPLGTLSSSNTPLLYSQWLNSVIYSATNNWVEARDAIWRGSIDASLCFHDVRQCNAIFLLSTMPEVHVKQQRYSQNCWWDFFMRWWKVGRIWRIRLLFCCFLCVRIKIGQFLCMICWAINHSLCISCK